MKNELQYKLTNYQEVPPAHVWADIEAALTDRATKHASVLYKFEQAPHPAIWNKIENSLESKEEKSIPLNKTIHFSKYAAAAAILILVASAITFIITRDHAGNNLANTPAPVENQNTSKSAYQNGDTNNQQQNTVGANNDQPNAVKNSSDLKKEKAAPGRYLTIVDEGKKIRLSKKVASVFDCADDVASVKSIRCKENIELLQQKISSSLVSPSGDFSGLMDMIKSLEENN